MASKTEAETTASNPVPGTPAPKAKRKIVKTRGPRIFVKYEVVDGNGQPIQGAVARLLGIERDANKILQMTLNHTLDGQYLMVEVPLINPPAAKGDVTQLPHAAE